MVGTCKYLLVTESVGQALAGSITTVIPQAEFSYQIIP
jgi:hypothetical protein